MVDGTIAGPYMFFINLLAFIGARPGDRQKQ
jgi:hypothetical protein